MLIWQWAEDTDFRDPRCGREKVSIVHLHLLPLLRLMEPQQKSPAHNVASPIVLLLNGASMIDGLLVCIVRPRIVISHI